MGDFSRLIIQNPEQAQQNEDTSTGIPFLTFPRKIRDQIYIHALAAPNQVNPCPRPVVTTTIPGSIAPPSSTIPSLAEYKPPTPTLLVANRQIYYEALPLLYSKNVFSIPNARDMFFFSHRMGRNCHRVKKIAISIASGISATSGARRAAKESQREERGRRILILG
jgi:hypothetical protein